jgi:hypothetical protein
MSKTSAAAKAAVVQAKKIAKARAIKPSRLSNRIAKSPARWPGFSLVCYLRLAMCLIHHSMPGGFGRGCPIGKTISGARLGSF